MTMWLIIFWTAMTTVWAAAIYLATRIASLLPAAVTAQWSFVKKAFVCGGVIVALATVLSLCLDFINAMVCLLYLAMIWLVTESVFGGLHRLFHLNVDKTYIGLTACMITIAALSVGWYLNHNVWMTHYTLTTEKDVPPLKIAMFADSHLGTTFHAEEFAQKLAQIQAQNPDIVFVVGDYVDDGTSRQEMIESTLALGKLKTKYGIYFVMGNHDKGYYNSVRRGFTKQDLWDELNKAGVNVLQDETVLVGDAFYIIGRQDYSVEQERTGRRLTMAELTSGLDKSKYMIVLDHQPADYARQKEADLVLSGHTHGGQLFTFNQVGKWIGANDLVYGYTRKDKTDFIVTSGLSDWAIQFKTGTKSEFVVIDVVPEK